MVIITSSLPRILIVLIIILSYVIDIGNKTVHEIGSVCSENEFGAFWTKVSLVQEKLSLDGFPTYYSLVLVIVVFIVTIVAIAVVMGITVFKAQQFCHDSSFSPLKLLSGGRPIAIACHFTHIGIIIIMIIRGLDANS